MLGMPTIIAVLTADINGTYSWIIFCSSTIDDTKTFSNYR